MRLFFKHALTALAFVVAGSVAAQYTGSSSAKPTSVAELLKSGLDDQQVVLQGVLLKKLGHEKYEFSDGTGTVPVEIDDQILPRETLDEKTRVEITGEFSKDATSSPEIDVDAIRRLP